MPKTIPLKNAYTSSQYYQKVFLLCIYILSVTPFASAQSFDELSLFFDKLNTELEDARDKDSRVPTINIIEANEKNLYRVNYDFKTKTVTIPYVSSLSKNTFYNLQIFALARSILSSFEPSLILRKDLTIEGPLLKQLFNFLTSASDLNFVRLKELSYFPWSEQTELRMKLHFLELKNDILSRKIGDMRNLFNSAFSDYTADFSWDGKEQRQNIETKFKELTQNIDWKRLVAFTQGLKTKKLMQAIKQNDRIYVANYLESKLPLDFLTEFELTFWKRQIEAIRNPSLEQSIIVYRGGPKSRFITKHFLESSRMPREGYDYLTMKSAVLDMSPGAMMKIHRAGASGVSFMSTTASLEVALEFGERSKTLSVLKIDPRRLISPEILLNHYHEAELLVFGVIFPDEIQDIRNGNHFNKTNDLEELPKKSNEHYEQEKGNLIGRLCNHEL